MSLANTPSPGWWSAMERYRKEEQATSAMRLMERLAILAQGDQNGTDTRPAQAAPNVLTTVSPHDSPISQGSDDPCAASELTLI